MFFILSCATVTFAIPPLPQIFQGKILSTSGSPLEHAILSVKLNANKSNARIYDALKRSSGITATTKNLGPGYKSSYKIGLTMYDSRLPGNGGAKPNDIVHIFIDGKETSQSRSGQFTVSEGSTTIANLSLNGVSAPTISNMQTDSSASLQHAKTSEASATVDAADNDTVSLQSAPYDTKKNLAEPRRTSYSFDLTAPTVNITKPANYTRVTDNVYTYEGTVTDNNSGIATVEGKLSHLHALSYAHFVSA